ncbi:MAG: efflux RND transporter permease subunit, partial [Spirochaetaceae bacterium]|nr:efflux RND transporter permease subunit [Spirochaetaceae bacterium]
DLVTLRNHIEREIKPRFEQMEDSGLIEISGGGMKEIHIRLDPLKAAQWNMSINQIASFIQEYHLYQPLGRIDRGNEEYTIVFNSQLNTIESLRNLPVNINGNSVPLQNLASVEYGLREIDSISRVNKEERVILYIYSSGKGNLINLSKDIENVLNDLQQRGYFFETIINQGDEIRKNIRNLFFILIIEIILVLLTLIFLGSAKQRLLIPLFIPIILFFTLAALSFLNITIDQYVLSGLAVGIGLLVDTGIVLTNHFEKQYHQPINTVVKPLIGSTLTTIIVLVPLFFMHSFIPGIKEISISIALLSLITLIINLVFIPPFFKVENKDRHQHAHRIESALQRLSIIFLKGVNLSIILHGLILILTVVLLIFIQKDFTRESQMDTVFMHIEFPSGYSPSAIDKEITDWQERLGDIPWVTIWQSKANRGSAQCSIRYDSKEISKAKVLDFFENNSDLLTHGQLYFSEDMVSKGFPIEVHLSGNDVFQLQEICRNTIKRFQEEEWVNKGVLHFKENPPSLVYTYDNDNLEQYSMNASQVGNLMKWFIQGPVAIKIPSQGREIDLRIMAPERLLTSVESIESIPVPITGQPIPFYSLATKSWEGEPSSIIHRNNQRSYSFSFVASKKDLDKTIVDVQTILESITLPEGYFFEIDRAIIEEKDRLNQIMLILLLALVFFYILLASITESYRIPIIVISILPSTFMFPLLFLFIFNIPLTSSVIVGLILLSGISVNNSILLCEGVSSINSEKNIYRKNQIILNSIKHRSMALLKTTLTTLLASLPLSILFFREQNFPNTLALITFWGILGSFFASFIMIPGILKKFY